MFLAPLTCVDQGVLMRGFEDPPPVTMPSPKPEQRPFRVPEIVTVLAEQPSRSTLPLDDLGRQRYSILDSLGLGDLATVEARVGQLSDDDLAALRYGFLDLAKCTLDRLIEQAGVPQPPTVIWADAGAPLRLLGATLMWADHYLMDDRVADQLATEAPPAHLADAISNLLEVRPLVEVGMIVPVLRHAATMFAGEKAYEQTKQDLGRTDLVEWVTNQLVMEGPTAKTALLFSVLDDEGLVNFFLHARIVGLDEENHTVLSRLLGPYDPKFDYDPWIAQCRRQTTASIIQHANLELAMADGFGASWVTLSPFRAKLLERRSDKQPEAQALVWAQVPHLEGGSALSLARVTADDVAVGALRERTRQAFAEMRHATPAERRERSADLAADLQYAAERLRRDMDRERRWKLAVPTGLSLAAIGLGATAGGLLVGGVVGALAAAAGLSPIRGDRLGRHEDASFALVLGDGLVEPRPTKGHPGGLHELSDTDFPRDIMATP